MKKIFKMGLVCISLLLLCGCDKFGNKIIYTTTYPIEYLTDRLYKEHSSIVSIYPDGSNPSEYQLTDKQITTFSDGDLFIYNGTTNEREIAKTFSNTNRKLKAIDAAYGLKYTYGIEELWLSPSNYLMLAANIKNNIKEQIGTKYINEEIDNKYKELENELSVMDANLRSVATKAKNQGKNTIVASTNTFKYLENYGFSVISLEDYPIGSSALAGLKGKFSGGTYKYVFVESNETTNDVIQEIVSSGGTAVVVNMMNTLTEASRKNNDNYFTIMNNYIGDIKNAVN